MSNPDRLLRISEAAAVLGVKPDILRRWADDGLISYFRPPGRQRYFRREDLDAFLAAHTKAEVERVAS